MPVSRRRVPKRPRKPSAPWRTHLALLDIWLEESPQGRELLVDRTLDEAREAVLGLLAAGLLDMRVTDQPGQGRARVEIVPTTGRATNG